MLGTKYRVEQVLGEGGMGVVVSAWHVELEQRVAVKFLLAELAERGDAAERFRREARAAVKIKSEHVARVLDVDTTEDGVPYMVMEYLEGNDLAQEIRTRGMLDVSEAVELVLQACEALAEAHAAGIVHRDLKPANLFIARRPDGSRSIKVLDFGISKQILTDTSPDLALTKTSALIGSPLYMSPEQMENARDVDTRTDIWALGAILYEAICGKPPFAGTSFPQVCSMVLNDTPAAPSEQRAGVPERLSIAILKCLEKKRDARWSTVAELAAAIAPFGSARSQISAERATRVLSASDPFIASIGEPPGQLDHTRPDGSLPAASIDVSISASAGASGTSSTNPAATSPATQVASTVDSWGKTGAEGEPRKAKTGAMLAAAAVTLLLIGAVGSYAVTRLGASAEAQPSTADELPAPAPEPAPAAAAIETPAAPASPEPATADAGTVAPPEPSTQPAPSPAAAKVVPKRRPKPGKLREKPPAGGNLSDFGGRE